MKNNQSFQFSLCLLFLFIGTSTLYSQIFTVKDIIVNGDNSTHINIVFLSEGYIVDELEQFNINVQNAMSDLFNTTPYAEYQSYFNVYAVEVPSNESGTDHPGNASDEPQGLPTFSADTYFNSTFDYAGIHRLLVAQNTSAIFSVLRDNVPDWDIAFIIVNHDWYGGSGGTFATFSLNLLSSEIAIHELGHSFAALADEYESGGLSGREAPNATSETMRDSIKWSIWIHESTPIPTPETTAYDRVVGLFEGAVYNPTGWYRPKLNCKMRTLNILFCEICAEQTILSVYNLVSVIESHQPSDTSLQISEDITQDFVIRRRELAINTVDVEWYLDDVLVGTNSDTFHFEASVVATGDHELKVIAADTSEMVRNDPDSYLMSSMTWQITVESAQSVNGYGGELPIALNLYQNYPNPFNPLTSIKYTLPISGVVLLTIYNLLGDEVGRLVDNSQPAGFHEIIWDASNVSSGIYFYRLAAGDFVSTKKMVLLR